MVSYRSLQLTNAMQKTEMHRDAVMIVNLGPLGYSGSSGLRSDVFTFSSVTSPVSLPWWDARLDDGEESAKTSFFSPSPRVEPVLKGVSVAAADGDRATSFGAAGFARENFMAYGFTDVMQWICFKQWRIKEGLGIYELVTKD